MRVLIGTHENCRIISSLKEGFEAIGDTATTVVKKRDKYFPDEVYNIDLSSRKSNGRFYSVIKTIPGIRSIITCADLFRHNRKCKKAFKNLDDFDLYIFIWDTILPKLKDLEILKKKGKKIFFYFIGSDARYIPAFKQEFPDIPSVWSEYSDNEDLNNKLFFLRKIELHANCIFSIKDQSGLLISPYMQTLLPINSDNFEFNYPDNLIPKIIHFPTNRNIKGTQVIIDALEKLKNKGIQFEFKMLEGLTNAEVKKELYQSDVVIEQIYFHGPGMSGNEAMASGCALATNFWKDENSLLSPPACLINPENLEIQLEKLLCDREYRQSLAIEGRKFIENNLHPSKIANRMKNIYNHGITKYDHVPRFFLDKFEPRKTDKVSDSIKDLNIKAINKFYKDCYDFGSLKTRMLIR